MRETSNPLRINLSGDRFDVFHKPVAQDTTEHNKNFWECFLFIWANVINDHNNQSLVKLNEG